MTDTADKIAELHREIDDNLMMRDGPLLAILKILQDMQQQIDQQAAALGKINER